jgi:hypothetical protein
VRKANKGVSSRHAYVLYVLCKLMYAPNVVPTAKCEIEVVLGSDFCSPWRSVLAMQEVGALESDDG